MKNYQKLLCITIGFMATGQAWNLQAAATHASSKTGLERMIKLQSSDNVTCIVDREILSKYSITFKNMIEEITDGSRNPIPLPNITGNTLENILRCIYNIGNAETIINELTQAQLIEFTEAINYLDIRKISNKIPAFIWFLDTLANSRIKIPVHTSYGIYSSAISPDNTYIATISFGTCNPRPDNHIGFGKKVYIQNAHTGKCLRSLEGHTGSITSVVISSNNKCVVTGSFDKTVRIWDMPTGKCLKILQEPKPIKSVAISSNNQLIVTIFFNGTAKIWDIQTNRCLQELHMEEDPIQSVIISSNNQFVVTLSTNGNARVWDIGTRSQQLIFNKSSITSVAVSLNNQLIATGSMDGIAHIWDKNRLNCLQTFEGHNSKITSITISSDNQFIVTSSTDGTTRIWNIQTGTCVQILNMGPCYASSVVINPDNKSITTRSNDGTTYIWPIVDLDVYAYMGTINQQCLLIKIHSLAIHKEKLDLTKQHNIEGLGLQTDEQLKAIFFSFPSAAQTALMPYVTLTND